MSFRINFDKIEQKKINALKEEFGIKATTELIRFVINREYGLLKKEDIKPFYRTIRPNPILPEPHRDYSPIPGKNPFRDSRIQKQKAPSVIPFYPTADISKPRGAHP